MNRAIDLKEWIKTIDADEVGGMSKNKTLKPQEKRFLYTISNDLRKNKKLSEKQINWLYEIYTNVKDPTKNKKYASEQAFIEDQSSNNYQLSDIRHLCLRLAWHDSKWNGKVCDSPENNIYCVGENSLLSDRIRKRRDLSIECKDGCRGKKPNKDNLGDYQPPCFWSINAFGNEHLEFAHDNPAAPDFPILKQPIAPYTVLSWPFHLSFVREKSQQNQYGKYYPTEIFEKRIKDFQARVEPESSIVFLYCKFSNPVSGEEMEYLVTGCAMLQEKGDMQWFEPTNEQLTKAREKRGQENFPTLNWALPYTIDFENTGVRLPYHEYLELINREGGISEDLLKEISVTAIEPELIDGFTYVAKHVDDDQAIYLLMKIRKSLLLIKEHGLVEASQNDESLKRIDYLLEHSWLKRGYLPGLKNLLLAIPNIYQDYQADVNILVEALSMSTSVIDSLIDGVNEGEVEGLNDSSILEELNEFLEDSGIDVTQFLVLASLNLHTNQYRRILNGDGLKRSVKEICNNPYLLFEEYEPSNITEDKFSGEKIDGPIDLLKVDISLFPHRKFLKPNKKLHQWKTDDKERLRAVAIEILSHLENSGHCFDYSKSINEKIAQYPLFYRFEQELKVKEDFKNLSSEVENHFKEKIVVKEIENEKIYYLKQVYDSEVIVQATIKKLLDAEDVEREYGVLEEDLEEAAGNLSAKIGDSFDSSVYINERKRLYEKVTKKKIYILSGSPGAGKSYELLKLTEAFKRAGETHVILSLTGKAVLRLKNNEEGFKAINASTIEKFIRSAQKDSAKGARRIINNLIIDESSMVDLIKLAEVLEAINIESNDFYRLILVGDENQLPPIGYGKPFVDLIDYIKEQSNYRENNYISLQANCRAELGESFISFTKVFSGQNKYFEPELEAVKEEGDICGDAITIKHWKDKEALYEKMNASISTLLDGVGDDSCNSLEELFGIVDEQTRPDGLERFQIITPYRTNYFGASGINLYFQQSIRTGADYIFGKIGDTAFKLYDKVMHTKNEYKDDELYVSNGSLGAIVSNYKIYFLEHETAINSSSLRNKEDLELAYAITVHKSQGSGFNHTFVIVPNKKGFLSRELLYTALTRARNKVTLFLQNDDDTYGVDLLLKRIRNNSAILHRRTSLFKDVSKSYAYIPEDGVNVRSRIEYIIYKSLKQAELEHGLFHVSYEEEYEVVGETFNLHPDFVLTFNDGRKIYWEHLGMVNSSSYLRGWDKKRDIYAKQNDIDKVLTTDELYGISSTKIDKIISMIVSQSLENEDQSHRYSDMHFSLN